MAHCVMYILNMPGSEFVRVLENPPDNDLLLELRATGSTYGARLKNDAVHFLVDLNGAITAVSLPVKASRLDFDPETRKQVEDWEKNLRAALPTAEILRIDEWDLEQSKYYSDNWIFNVEASQRIFDDLRRSSKII